MRRLVLAVAVLSLSACDLITGVPVEAAPCKVAITQEIEHRAEASAQADSLPRAFVGYCLP